MRFDSMLGRGIWMSLLAAAAVVAVILSWMVPEPAQQPGSGQRIEQISYSSCVEQAPTYGRRTADPLDAGCDH